MSGSKCEIRVRRIYGDPEKADGARVLVDRIWPRGMAKDRAALDGWIKAVAPSNELRRWYGHDPEHYEEFVERYRVELEESERADALDGLRERSRAGPLTLLTASRNVEYSHAAVLASLLRARR